MLLYQDPQAPNPRRVRVFVAEKGLSLHTVDVLLIDNANLAPTYLAKHPLGLLPILELNDGRVLRESIAICRYLEELHPEPNLFGNDAWERATIEQWNRHAELELLYPIAQVFRNSHKFWANRIRQSPEFAAIMKDQALARMAWLDGELAKREYLAGDRFSVADITALCAIDFGKPSDIRVQESQVNLKRWYDAVKARPSSKA